MTVSYSLDVSKARFCGFTKLLIRWKGSIYKILWKEFLLFCAAYAMISIIYRCFLNSSQREIFEKVVLFVETFTDFIPLSFVLGFYVSLVVGRWANQYEAIPWPDRVCFTISSYVHGSDDRSRKIRRTLGRYLILLQVLTFQMVSTAVKRRFPTTHHLVEAGIMTKEEQSVYEKIPFHYGKYWLPCQWFTALATRAKKEGRIKDSILLDGLLREMFNFRNNCAIMIGYDWISVPLVYTQVVTIATYMYSIALLVGRQYINPTEGHGKFQLDLYVPLFTLLQFFFYVGWLKVAEQILNPYGEDDDDYELNWLLDRTVNVVYMIVDHQHMKHPKVKEDAFWDEPEILLPQTKHSAKWNPELGSAHGLHYDDPEYIPMDELLEEDSAENFYKGESMKRKNSVARQSSSFIKRVFNSGFSQSFQRKSRKTPVVRTFSSKQGCSNPAFSMSDEMGDGSSCRSSEANTRKSSLNKVAKRMSSQSNINSVKFKVNRQKSYNFQDAEIEQIPNGIPASKPEAQKATRTVSAPTMSVSKEFLKNDYSTNDDFEANPEEQSLDVPMPSIPEEASRANSLASIELMAAAQRGERASQQMDRVHDLVKEATEVLEEISKSVTVQERWKDNEGKGYESCCSADLDNDSSVDNSSDENEKKVYHGEKANEVFVVIEGCPKETIAVKTLKE